MTFAGAVHKRQGQTLKEVVVDLRFLLLFTWTAVCRTFSHRKPTDPSLLVDQENTLASTAPIQNIPGPVSNPVLREPFTFAESS